MNTKQIKKCVVVVLAVACVCAAYAQSAVRDLANIADAYMDSSREKREQESAPDHIKEIFALAKTSAEEDFNINFCGFFTGMSRYDAQDLVTYYKLKDGEFLIGAAPGKAVSKLWFSLKGVRRITRGGSTLDELAQAVANRVGNLKKDYDSGEWRHKTIDGIVVTFDGKGLTIQNVQVTSQAPLATTEAARKDKADMDAAEKAGKEAVARLIRDMIAIPGMSFDMCKYEVTQAQWQAIMGENPSEFKGDDNPVEKVSWKDCKKFIEKLNALPEVKASGLTFRLPTEKEWEYACRAGSEGHYCKLADGTEITKSSLGEVAWYDDNSGNKTHPVGQKKPNAFGLYDMHGNVGEWCDFFGYASSDRVGRGGSWWRDSELCSAGDRYWRAPGLRVNCLGFRLAAEDPARKERAAKEAIPRLVRDMIAIPGKSFKIGKYEVTQAQWQAVMGENPSDFKNADNPVENVSWDDCTKFIEKLNALPEVKASGLTFRLPTEKEWEYACRAGSTGDYCKLADGTEITESTLGKVAWYNKSWNFYNKSETYPVGQKKPNAFGLYDMHGNLDEWCDDLDEEAGSPRRMHRGGSSNSHSNFCTAGYRSSLVPDYRSSNCGFRLAAEDPVRKAEEAARKAEEAARKARAAAEEAVRKERAAKEAISRLVRDMITIPGKFLSIRSFKIGKYEVTQAQWQAVMGENPSHFKGWNNPVENVSWDDCQEFLKKLNALPAVKESGLVFRLPTAKEWEYACRAGSKGDYCKLADGTEITGRTLGEVAWYEDNSSRKTHPVGQKKPNAFGLYDMHGNVWEWCEDRSSGGDSHRVGRGGCWYYDSSGCTAGARCSSAPGRRDFNLGFRLAADQD